MIIGEGVSGSDHNRAHVNVLLGDRTGPIGTSFASTVSGGQAGLKPFMAVVKPGVLARPITLLVSKSGFVSQYHSELIYGPAQLGVSKALVDSLTENQFPEGASKNWVGIVAIFVPDDANNADEIFLNNLLATREAIINALGDRPRLDECLSALPTLGNRYYQPSEFAMSQLDIRKNRVVKADNSEIAV